MVVDALAVTIDIAVDILADVWAGAITSGPTDVRDKVNATGLPAAMNTLEFAAPPPSEDPFLC